MKQEAKLIWVYPPNNWKSTSRKTFVYGWSNPKAKLYVSVGATFTVVQKKIKIFPSGNFAQTINLPYKKNIVRLIQILDKKRTILKRKISVGADPRVCPKLKKGEHIGSPLQNKNNIVIVIDPGHGGKEHGTHSPKGIPEKHFNLQIAKLLFNKLKNVGADLCVCPNVKQGEHTGSPLPRYKIYLTRNTDKFVSLKERVNFAKRKKCNVFISIHHNALPDGKDPLKHRGVGVYYTNNFVKPLAKRLLNNISQFAGTRRSTPLRKYGLFKRDFFVTRPRFYKGILIECGFLTHPIEAEYITKREIQEKIVRGIVKTLSLYTSQPF